MTPPLHASANHGSSFVSLDVKRLNIEGRTRTSRLPWKGQFSPELIEYLMTAVAAESRTFLDPFCGSGTVLYEALARGGYAQGIEVNPAAWHLATLASIATLESQAQRTLVRDFKEITIRASQIKGGLYRENSEQTILESIKSPDTSWHLRLALAAAVLLGMGNSAAFTTDAVARGAFQVLNLLREIASRSNSARAECLLGDARYTPIPKASIDTVITSPPYINVFNYHQNYRPATEILGWNALEAARTEIGSNRRNRMNRFLTVIQYCIDMSIFIEEMARVLKTEGNLILIIGKTSNVLGCSFRNGALVRALLEKSEAFDMFYSIERVFKNRWGELIYEDIIVSKRIKPANFQPTDVFAIARMALNRVASIVALQNKAALFEALDRLHEVQPSQRLNLSIPQHFRR